MTEAHPQDSSEARTAVVSAALELFSRHGFEATSVDQIASAAGISRSTFFRQFGGKEDVIFADHDVLLARLADELAAETGNPWEAVCEASVTVFKHFVAHPELARTRSQVIRRVPALRDREIVAGSRYSQLFTAHLREHVDGIDPVEAVAFAAAVTATHNHILREMVHGTRRVPVSTLRRANDVLLARFGVGSAPRLPQADDVVVAAFPRNMPAAEIARRVRDTLAADPV